MAYKQSPFPMIAGTSPVKGKLKLLQKGYNLAKKGVKAVRTAYQKAKGTYTDKELHKRTGYWRQVDLDAAYKRDVINRGRR
tara:strand:+ start:388 stop:630 length:243 start_codon:yes stop_codon:yes gene_type:complete